MNFLIGLMHGILSFGIKIFFCWVFMSTEGWSRTTQFPAAVRLLVAPWALGSRLVVWLGRRFSSGALVRSHASMSEEPMKPLVGDSSIKPPDLELVEHLIWYEGPILSHMRDMAIPGDHWMVVWVDGDLGANRWMYLNVFESEVQSYIDRKVSLRDIELGQNWIFLVDLGPDGEEVVASVMVKVADVPPEHLAGPDSFYSKNLNFLV